MGYSWIPLVVLMVYFFLKKKIALKSRGQQQSKAELLYQQVESGNSYGIKALRREGAGLEWIGKEGKTPLILACMNPSLYNVAKTLIELGANVNAYRPGRDAGTPLHHAAKRGLDQIVKLLLSHGANALVMIDDCQTPLDVARIKGFSNVVGAIESHICLFSGWLGELYGPGFLQLFAPQFFSGKVWIVVLPIGSWSLWKPFNLELAVYANLQDAQPRTIVALRKANMEEPNFSQTDPMVVHPRFPFSTAPHVVTATAPPTSEDVELATAISASLQSAVQERPPHLYVHPVSQSNPSTSRIDSESSCSGQGPETAPVELVAHRSQTQSGPSTTESTIENSASAAIPSAPPLEDSVIDDGRIYYPSIDSSPLDFAPPPAETSDAAIPEGKTEAGTNSSSCVICLDTPIEGACIPCGHMAGCMSCLNEIKAKKWGCPVCRAKIDQVVRLYAV